MKALELLYEYQQADEIAGGYMSKPINEAIEEIHMLLMYKYLADNYLKIEKCKCGAIKVRGYLCPNKECTEVQEIKMKVMLLHQKQFLKRVNG